MKREHREFEEARIPVMQKAYSRYGSKAGSYILTGKAENEKWNKDSTYYKTALAFAWLFSRITS